MKNIVPPSWQRLAKCNKWMTAYEQCRVLMNSGGTRAMNPHKARAEGKPHGIVYDKRMRNGRYEYKPRRIETHPTIN